MVFDLLKEAGDSLGTGTALKLFRDEFERHIDEGRCSYREPDRTGGR
jgi:hypothetical protein